MLLALAAFVAFIMPWGFVWYWWQRCKLTEKTYLMVVEEMAEYWPKGKGLTVPQKLFHETCEVLSERARDKFIDDLISDELKPSDIEAVLTSFDLTDPKQREHCCDIIASMARTKWLYKPEQKKDKQ